MISSPQGDLKHTGHVGLDGAYFGDVSFLGDKVKTSLKARLLGLSVGMYYHFIRLIHFGFRFYLTFTILYWPNCNLLFLK